MKKIFILQLLILTNFTFGNNWYVSNTSSGNGNGSSWANKDDWTTFNWSNVNPGDIVYVDGGSSGLTYNSSFNIARSGSSGNPITITKGIDAGHNGQPHFSLSSGNVLGTITGNYLIIDNIKFTHNVVNIYQCLLVQGNSVYIQYCTINNPGNKGIRIEGDYCKILYNTIDTGTSDPSGANPDGLWIGGQGRDLEVAYCQILMRNGDSGNGSHKDNIQSYMWQTNGSTSYGTTKIHHNFFYSAEVSATSNTPFELSAIGGNWEIYDNIVVYGGVGVGRVMYLGNCDSEGADGIEFSAKIYNNTFYIDDGNYYGVMFDDTDTLIFKNNIVWNLNGNYQPLNLGDVTVSNYMDINYNQYVCGSTSEFLYQWSCSGNSEGYSWASYKNTLGQDANSEVFTTSAGFDLVGSSFPSLDANDYALEGSSTGINEGTSISLVLDDYEGTPRPQGSTYDAGAFEFSDGSSNNVNVKSKIFLQGPFSTYAMLTTLNQSSLIPNSQPYNSPPWNYNGNENFNASSNSTVVDWVLVELRIASNPVQVVSRRAALLKNNGLLLETNGTEGIIFTDVSPGSYYIVLYHRDHLAIMSASPVPLSSNSSLYDFTTAMNKAFGQNPMIELTPGKFGLYAADGNADGIIDIIDRDDVWLIQNGNMGYLQGDFNMNSGVTVHDVNQLWNINNGKMTQVPF